MSTIKLFTDLPQSKKLTEILPLESSDMHYMSFRHKDDTIEWIPQLGTPSKYDIPCWSLAALLNVMPKDESIECSISYGYYNGKGEYIEKWLCAFEKEGETTDDLIIETIDGSNPVDACYEMILKLHELKML